MAIDNITSIKSSIINRKIITHPFNPIILMLLAEKVSEINPKHKGYFFLFQNVLLRTDIILWY